MSKLINPPLEMPENNPVTPRMLLVWLVENAMDFVTRSIDEFDNDPKYSVIHFYSAVELFLKARLLAEHWSLVVSVGKTPDWEKFVEGDFLSVTLDQAAEKLDRTVRSPLKEDALDVFRKLATHRNKTVHFFHGGLSNEASQEMRKDLARERLKAWYFLHGTLVNQWTEVFSYWTGQLEDLNDRMRNLRDYLQIIYDQLKPEIEQGRKNGTIWEECPSCKFPALACQPILGVPEWTLCSVCGFAAKYLNIDCPDCHSECGKPVVFLHEGFGKCACCERDFNPEQLAEALIDPIIAREATKNGDSLLANCDYCDANQTVVHVDQVEGQYFCTFCFSFSETIENCLRCGEPNTGDMSNSAWAGCNACGIGLSIYQSIRRESGMK